jgi:hypothetical protein
MQLWRNSLRIKINTWRMRRYRQNRTGHRAAKNELRETQILCAAKANLSRPMDCLRSEELRPPLLIPSRLEAVDAVRAERKRLIVYESMRDNAAPEAATSGRLIAYNPDFNLACGTSEVETNGYFDVNNTPPWDTWVALLDAPGAKCFETSLIAWVPPIFLSLVQAGIEVIPEQCVRWLDDCPPSLQHLWKKIVTNDREEPRLLAIK